MPKPIEGQARYMPGLDGLRALAVLAVIFYHLEWPFAPGGLLGVNVFFVLSGYLITDLLLAHYEKTGNLNLRLFWVRRARRLLPALWALLLIVMSWVIVFNPHQVIAIRQDVLAAFLYVSNWWYIYHHVSYFAQFGPPSPLTHLWSLAVEEQFYLLWPLVLLGLLRFVKTRHSRLILVLMLALISSGLMAILYHPGANPNRVYYGTDTRAFALLIGAALALLWPSRHLPTLSLKQRYLIDLLGLLGLLVFVAMVLFTNEYQPFLYQGGMLFLAVMTAFLVAALAAPWSYLTRILGSRPLRWLGVRSYGIYLWHYPVIVFTTPLATMGTPNILRGFLQILASIGIAALSWHFLEQPIRQGRWDKNFQQIIHLSQWKRLSYKVWATAILVLGLVVLDTSAMSGLLYKTSVQAADPVTTTQIVPSSSGLTLGNSSPSWAPLSKNLIKSSSSLNMLPSSGSPSATKTPSSSALPSSSPTSQDTITAIGDSIMIDATPYLRQLLPGIVISAQIGRQFIQAPAVIAQLRQDGLLGHYVIVELGTNGPFTLQQLDALIASLGHRQIIFVNTRVPRPWQNIVNSTLAQGAQQFPGHVHIVNWYQASAGKSSYFYPDGVHLNPQGAAYYASLIAHTVKMLEERHSNLFPLHPSH
ncbi:acyltransferase family protein [Sulfobacillus thermosulfidooxidans]|uniref:acyltransferase family protein n=1 Tax=Sulfobacillus thermosulfidooxidans TaxID=28034 RepID=UPI00040F3673|nr:acyltransferase family protein [Sulfobacillus thermosulfidooxidans]